MSELSHAANRQFQDLFDTRRLADHLEEHIIHNTMCEQDRDVIEHMDMFFLATVDADGRPQCSYKGGDPGFVRVIEFTPALLSSSSSLRDKAPTWSSVPATLMSATTEHQSTVSCIGLKHLDVPCTWNVPSPDGYARHRRDDVFFTAESRAGLPSRWCEIVASLPPATQTRRHLPGDGSGSRYHA